MTGITKTPLTARFEDTAAALVRQDALFARGLLQEAAQALLGDEVPAARNMLRHVIKGTIGYRALSRCTGTPEKSLIRMFGPRGSPTAANLFAILSELQRHIGVQLTVAASPVERKRSRGRSASRSLKDLLLAREPRSENLAPLRGKLKRRRSTFGSIARSVRL